MKVLYVVGSCLTKNTSANMSHNSFIKGLLDCGADVEVLMANESWGEEDKALPRFEKVKYYQYNATSVADKVRTGYKKKVYSENASINTMRHDKNQNQSFKDLMRRIAKKGFYLCFPQDPVYPLEKIWLRKASSFRSQVVYDVIISNSSPAASHKMVDILLKSNHILGKRWIQIWEDPWFYDLYGGHSGKIEKEEHYLLRRAQEIYYVSPLTLMYQKRHYFDCADKMQCIPLPYFEFSKEIVEKADKNSFGYFGDYYSKTRNLLPFYEALKVSGYEGRIYGDSDLLLKETDKIEVSGRVTLDVLSEVQAKTQVLVHLCNLHGGQIPGKIYHYSATRKPILFIIDGTEEEQKSIQNFFSKYNRYYFCKNDTKSIVATMKQIVEEQKIFEAVTAFRPKEVIRYILEKG